jgi:hypothetical protein
MCLVIKMRKLEEYFQHAAECREMARTASPAHRQQLEQMAETWEQLAEARRRKLERKKSDGSGPTEGQKHHPGPLIGRTPCCRIDGGARKYEGREGLVANNRGAQIVARVAD